MVGAICQRQASLRQLEARACGMAFSTSVPRAGSVLQAEAVPKAGTGPEGHGQPAVPGIRRGRGHGHRRWKMCRNVSPLAPLCLQAAFTGQSLPLKSFVLCFEALFGALCLRFTKGGQGGRQRLVWLGGRHGLHDRQRWSYRLSDPTDA